MPGPLRKAAGFHDQEFSSLREPLALRDDPFHVGSADNKASEWAEMILPDTAKALAYYDHPFFGRYAAITQNTFGKGSLTYEGTVLTDSLQRAVLVRVLEQAGLVNSDQRLPAAIHVKHAQNRNGKALHFYMNFSSAPQSVEYNYAAGRNLLIDGTVSNGQSLSLQLWDLAIIEEQ